MLSGEENINKAVVNFSHNLDLIPAQPLMHFSPIENHLVLSKLVKELKEANALVVSTPMYNFSIPASLKAWIDMVCRAGETFRYTENGPEGLLTNIDTMYLIVATGGAPVGSPVDFVVPYMKQIASFLGIKNVEVIAADRMNVDADASLAKAREEIAALSENI